MRIQIFPNYKKTHPPSWLEGNRWFRKFYALKRTLGRKRFSVWSETDIFVRHLIQLYKVLPAKGFYVDVGCFHPKKLNNTYHLYREGWRGVNIDIDKTKIEAFRIVRPEDVNIACAVSNQVGEVEYWKQSFWSILNTLGEQKPEHHEGGKWKKAKAYADTLTNLLDQTAYANQPIDFLSIDVEGHELPVFRTLEFDRYRPKVICVETWDLSLPQVVQSDLYKFLTHKGYILINWVNLNLIFIHHRENYPDNAVAFLQSRRVDSAS